MTPLDQFSVESSEVSTANATRRKRVIDRKLKAVIYLTTKFIQGEHLYIPAFKLAYEEIEDMHWELDGLLTDPTPYDPDLVERLAYAKDLFWTLKGEIGMLEFYDIHKPGSQHLVHYVVRLIIVLTGLLDNFGKPDPTIDGYEDIVNRYIHILDFWKWKYDHLREKDKGVSLYSIGVFACTSPHHNFEILYK